MAKILVVDDDPDMRWLLTGILEVEGFTVVTAADGQAALGQVMVDAPVAVIRKTFSKIGRMSQRNRAFALLLM